LSPPPENPPLFLIIYKPDLVTFDAIQLAHQVVNAFAFEGVINALKKGKVRFDVFF
jgi:hypothetical protein